MVLTKALLTQMMMERLADVWSKQRIEEFVAAFFEEICHALEQGETVKLPGLGKFVVLDKHERPGRNPRTGEEKIISARRVVTFHPSAKLKERFNNPAK